MAEPDNPFVATQIGGNENKAALEQHRKRQRRKEREGMWTQEVAIVERYHFEEQRVDVKLKMVPGSPTFANVPILGRGGPAQAYYRLPSIESDGIGDAHIGVLFFPRTESYTAWDDREVQAPTFMDDKHAGQSPFFLPNEALLTSEDLPKAADAESSDADSFGPDDFALVLNPNTDQEVSVYVKTDSGNVVVQIPDDAKGFFISESQSVNDAKQVARKGDATGDGSSVTEGSSRWHVGD